MVFNEEIHWPRWIGYSHSVADQLQRDMLARFRCDQQIRLCRVLGDRLDVNEIWFAFVVFGLEFAGTAQNYRCDLLRHADRGFKLRPQMQHRDLSRVDGDADDTPAHDRIRRVYLKGDKDCDGYKPAELHGVDLRGGLDSAALRISYRSLTA